MILSIYPGCEKNDGSSGDGTTQGNCPTGTVCDRSGKCLGTCVFICMLTTTLVIKAVCIIPLWFNFHIGFSFLSFAFSTF